MKYLVVYYSRTGNNKTIGEAIAKALSSDIDEIIDKKKRAGKIAWLQAGRDALAKKLTDIQFEKNPQDYDVIILGSPIWAGNIPPALRTYLTKHDLKGKKVAFYICSQSDGYNTVFPILKELIPESENIGTLGITEKQFKQGSYKPELSAFISSLK